MSLKPLGPRNAVENELTTPKDLLEKQCHKADFQQVNRFLKRKIQPKEKPENDFHKPKRLEIEVRNLTQNTLTLNSKHSALLRFPHWQLTPN
nr:hypothetical protein BBM46_03585 [Vibrio parahaemolyticus]